MNPMLQNLLKVGALCVLALFAAGVSADAGELDKEYEELANISYNGEGPHDPEAVLRQMVAFIEQHPLYEVAGNHGMGLVRNFGYVIYRLPADRRPVARRQALQSVEALLRNAKVSKKTRAMARASEFDMTMEIEREKETPDAARVRAVLDKTVAAYEAAFGAESSAQETMRLRQRYIRLLASTDAGAALDYLQDLRSKAEGETAQRLEGLIEETRLWRTPMELTFTALDKRQVDVAKLRGKVVLVNFTGVTWCYGCRIQEPILKAVYDKYHDKGFEIISVTNEGSADKRAAVEKLLAERGLSWPHSFDGLGTQSPLIKKYDIAGFPSLWLLNRDGLLVSTAAFGENLEPLVRKHLGL
jgi:thiol-disulfide isomerase/thioredoxin